MKIHEAFPIIFVPNSPTKYIILNNSIFDAIVIFPDVISGSKFNVDYIQDLVLRGIKGHTNKF